MSITGGIKFFSKNKLTISTSIVASSGSSSTTFLADENYFTNWRSAGSTDVAVETITITFASATPISRIHLLGHNLKNYTIKYNTSSNFSSVTSLDASGLSSIAETVYSRQHSYYEFSQVSVTSVVITMNTTQIADEEKYIRKIKITNEYGTLLGYPKIDQIKVDRGLIVDQMISKRSIIEKQFDTFAFNLSFDNYPSKSSYTSDYTLMDTLAELEEPFYVWLCGGRFGSTYFRQTIKGFRLQDVILMDFAEDITQSYNNNIYISTINMNYALREVSL